MSEATTTTARPPRLAASRLLAIAVLLGGASACESDPAGVGRHDEGDVTSFRLELVPPESEPLYVHDNPTNPDTLSLADNQSYDIRIEWLDEHGDEVNPDEDDHTWSLETVTGVSFMPSDSDPWAGTLTTIDLLPGNELFSAIRVRLRHAGEIEFGTSFIPVRIES